MRRRILALCIIVLSLVFCDSGLESRHATPSDGDLDSRPFGIQLDVEWPPEDQMPPCVWYHLHNKFYVREVKTDTPEREPEGAKCEFPCS